MVLQPSNSSVGARTKTSTVPRDSTAGTEGEAQSGTGIGCPHDETIRVTSARNAPHGTGLTATISGGMRDHEPTFLLPSPAAADQQPMLSEMNCIPSDTTHKPHDAGAAAAIPVHRPASVDLMALDSPIGIVGTYKKKVSASALSLSEFDTLSDDRNDPFETALRATVDNQQVSLSLPPLPPLQLL